MHTKNTASKKIYDSFIEGEANVAIEGSWKFEISRADGTVETSSVQNTLTAAGLDHLARLGVTNGVGSAFIYLAIGTQTDPSSLGSVQAGLGEVDRKIGAVQTSSREVMILSSTWAGAADGISSLDLRTASAVNHPDSGSGIHLNFVNSVSTVLADSDFLRIEMNVRVGSHNI